MNDRYRNVYKAHDHIVKCRTKEGKRIFIPRWGYVIIPSDKLLAARIKKTFTRQIVNLINGRGNYGCTMQRVQV